jgi:hypothetical protein
MGTSFLLALLGGFLSDAFFTTYHVYLISAVIELIVSLLILLLLFAPPLLSLHVIITLLYLFGTFSLFLLMPMCSFCYHIYVLVLLVFLFIQVNIVLSIEILHIICKNWKFEL